MKIPFLNKGKSYGFKGEIPVGILDSACELQPEVWGVPGREKEFSGNYLGKESHGKGNSLGKEAKNVNSQTYCQLSTAATSTRGDTRGDTRDHHRIL